MRDQNAGPILSKRAATASEFTSMSNGPVLGVIWRKYWFSASGSRENCTPGKWFGQIPMRKMLNQVCSSGVA